MAKVNLEGGTTAAESDSPPSEACRVASNMASSMASRVASCAAPVMVQRDTNAGARLSDQPVQPRQGTLRRWLPLVLLGAVLAVVLATGSHRLLSLETIALNKIRLESLVESHMVAALAIYMAVYILIIALSIPGSLAMTLTGGILFPLWICAPAVLVAATTGATIVFLIARTTLGEALRDKGGEAVARMSEGIRRDAASYMLFLRLVPLFPFALVNLAPAIVGVPLRTFIWTTFVGVMPASFTFSFAATSLDSLLDERLAVFEACKTLGRTDCALSVDASTLVSPRMLLAFSALGLLALVPVAIRWLGFGKAGAIGKGGGGG